MLKRLGAALLILLLACGYALAQAQSKTLCGTGNAPPNDWTPCIPSGGSTIGSAVPGTGVYNAVNVIGTLRGWSGLSTGSIFPGAVAIVDASGNQITTFGGAATSSNASSGVATSSTNQAAVAWLYGFNGTTWDQVQVDGSKNLKVAVQSAIGLASPSTTSGSTGSIVLCASTTNPTGQATTTNAFLNCDPTGPLRTSPTPVSTGGMTTTFFQPGASDNHTNVKNGAGQVYWILAANNSATVNYLRLYNAASGFNGCNSATNLVTQIQIPASTSVGGVSIPLPYGIPFSTGISYCVTSGYATNDTTNAIGSAMSITIGYN